MLEKIINKKKKLVVDISLNSLKAEICVATSSRKNII
jgi:hypothetical protein